LFYYIDVKNKNIYYFNKLKKKTTDFPPNQTLNLKLEERGKNSHHGKEAENKQK